MKKMMLWALAMWMSGSVAMAAPFCVENEKDYLENKEKLPKVLREIPFYMTMKAKNAVDAATKIFIVNGKFRTHSYFLAGYAREENADLKKICFEDGKFTLVSQKFEEKKSGEVVYKSEKEDEFTVTSDSAVSTKRAFMKFDFDKVTEQAYKKRGQEIMGPSGTATSGTSGGQNGVQ